MKNSTIALETTAFNSVVVDLETLDISPSAVILTIGAVMFDINTIDVLDRPREDNRREMHLHLENRAQMLNLGRTVTPSTIQWWTKQDEEAKKAIFCDASKYLTLKNALLQLTEFIGDKKVYFRGTDFDGAILEHAYQQCELKAPWKYNAKRDIRTFIDAKTGSDCGYIDGLDKPDWITKHRADHDALWDAYQLQLANKPGDRGLGRDQNNEGDTVTV
jgi:hypothetical protein